MVFQDVSDRFPARPISKSTVDKNNSLHCAETG
jgi:hypothetical protein